MRASASAGLGVAFWMASLAVAPSLADESLADAPALAAELKLVAIVLFDDEASAGFVKKRSNQPVILRVGESCDGLQLMAIDPAGASARVRKGAAEVLFKMSAQAVVSPPASSSEVDRRRMPAQSVATNAHPSKLSAEALQKHLSDYKLEVIRQGLPALPIPLTPEEDEKLVKEGVLPPLDDPPAAPAPTP